jgi:hypothetical protein
MKKLYIVISDWDNYSDHYKINECVCSSLSLAESKKEELESEYRKEVPFPFDYCTKSEFFDLWDEGKVTEQDIDIFEKWHRSKIKRENFNCCFINEIDYYE